MPSAPIRDGEEELVIPTLSWEATRDLFSAPGMLRVPENLEGLRCTFTNDKGSWSLVVPGHVKVQRSAHPLLIECTGERFAPYQEVRQCLTRREREGRPGARQLSPLALPIVILALPLAPAAGAQALSSISLAWDGDACSYGSFAPKPARR